MKRDIGFWTCTVAVPFVVFSIFCVVPLFRSRPFAPITATLFLLPGALPLLVVALCPRALPKRHRLKRVLAVGLGTLLVGYLLLSLLCCACITLPMPANHRYASMYLAASPDNAKEASSIKDTYGGRFHGAVQNGQGRVWSDGPNGKDDGGTTSAVSTIRTFEAGFQTNYGESFLDSMEAMARQTALWEHTFVWGRFNGDIVWQADGHGGLNPVE